MKQIFQNNFQQYCVCTLIKHHTVLFTLNFNSTSDRDLGCCHALRQFLPNYDQVRVEPFTKQHTRTRDLGTRTTEASGTNNPLTLSRPCRNLFCGRGINHFGMCRGRTTVGTQASTKQKLQGGVLERKLPGWRLCVVI